MKKKAKDKRVKVSPMLTSDVVDHLLKVAQLAGTDLNTAVNVILAVEILKKRGIA